MLPLGLDEQKRTIVKVIILSRFLLNFVHLQQYYKLHQTDPQRYLGQE